MVFILIAIYCDLAPDLSTIARRLPLTADGMLSLVSVKRADTYATPLFCVIVCTAIELTIDSKAINKLMACISQIIEL